MSFALRPLRSTNTRAAILLLVAIGIALSFSLGAVTLDTGSLSTGATGFATHLSHYVHVPLALAYAAVQAVASGGAIAGCLFAAWLCPLVFIVEGWIAQIGIAAAALA